MRSFFKQPPHRQGGVRPDSAGCVVVHGPHVQARPHLQKHRTRKSGRFKGTSAHELLTGATVCFHGDYMRKGSNNLKVLSTVLADGHLAITGTAVQTGACDIEVDFTASVALSIDPTSGDVIASDVGHAIDLPWYVDLARGVVEVLSFVIAPMILADLALDRMVEMGLATAGARAVMNEVLRESMLVEEGLAAPART